MISILYCPVMFIQCIFIVLMFLVLVFFYLNRSPVCADLLATRGDSVRFALRARVYNYAEDAVAAWCFFAVKYKSVL